MNTGLIDKVQCLWTNRNNDNEVISLFIEIFLPIYVLDILQDKIHTYEESMPSVETAETSMWVNYKPCQPVFIQGYQTRAQIKVYF